jgi:hypothetical protein
MQGEVTKKGTMDSKSEQAEMTSKNERSLMDLDDDTHREDQFSSSYETPRYPWGEGRVGHWSWFKGCFHLVDKMPLLINSLIAFR